MPRIVSLLPAATDIVAALGRSADLVGVTDVGVAVGAEEAAAELVSSLQARLDALSGPVGTGRPSAVVDVEWIDPLFVGGHWIPDMVEAAGHPTDPALIRRIR